MSTEHRRGDDPSAGRASRWATSDFPAVVLLVVMGAMLLGALLSPMAVGANMKGQGMLAIAPWAIAVLVSARARRSPWSYFQRLVLHLVLAAAVILIWIAIFTQPREEFDAQIWRRPSPLSPAPLHQERAKTAPSLTELGSSLVKVA